MNKIVPFNKDLFFKTNIKEITSISIEKEVNIKENSISGNFILQGDYIISEDTKEHHQEFQGDLNITKTVLKFQAIEYV